MARNSDSRFTGRRILVTGAASGIGLTTCRRLAAEGGAVVGLDRDARLLGEAMEGLRRAGHQAHEVVVDVSDHALTFTAVDEAAVALGGLDGVACVAGIGSFTGDVTEVALETWQRDLAVNLTGVFNVCRASIPHLRQRAGGAIVTVSSQYGLVGCAGSPSYCASKAGVIGLTRAMAIDHAPDGIRVNCVCPGPIDTPMLAASVAQESAGRAERERVGGRLTLGQPGRPEDVAATIAFLLSADACFITGTALSVDGGWTGA